MSLNQFTRFAPARAGHALKTLRTAIGALFLGAALLCLGWVYWQAGGYFLMALACFVVSGLCFAET